MLGRSFITALVALVGLTLANQTPAEADLAIRDHPPTYFEVQGFTAWAYEQDTSEMTYAFLVRGFSRDKHRIFPHAFCSLRLPVGDFVEVTSNICDSQLAKRHSKVFFSMNKKTDENGEFLGWNFGIRHDYLNKINVPHLDRAHHFIDKSLVVTNGTTVQYEGPRKFNMTSFR